MNVYDFDGTIYHGDSTADFISWCVKKKPSLIFKHIKKTLPSFLAYKTSLCSKTDFKENMYSYLLHLKDAESLVKEFWFTHINNIANWYLEQKNADDIIISASPEFLLKPVCDKLNVRLLASKVDIDTGCYLGINCFGAEKTRRFYEVYGGEIDKFYSDSKSDEPLALLAHSAYMVDGDKITPWVFD